MVSADLEKYFSESDQERMRADDSSAWRNVTGLLLCVVTGGVLLITATVLLIFSLS